MMVLESLGTQTLKTWPSCNTAWNADI